MLAAQLSQLFWTLVGGAISAVLQKGILKWIIRADPQFWPLLTVILVMSALIHLAGLGQDYAGLGGRRILLIAGLFVQAAAISRFVPRTDQEKISFGQAILCQLILVAFLVATLFLIRAIA